MLSRKRSKKSTEYRLFRIIFPAAPFNRSRRPAIGAFITRLVSVVSVRQPLTDLPAERMPFLFPPRRLPSVRAAVEAFLDAAGRNIHVRRWRQWRWCAVVVMLALLLGAVCSSNVLISKASPMLAVSNAASGTLADLGDRFETSPLVFLRHLAVGAQYGEISADFDYRGTGGSPLTGNVRLLCNGLGKDFGALATISEGEKTGSFEAYLNQKRVAFAAPQTAGTCYGITFDTYDPDLSAFTGTSGLSGTSVETMTELVNYLNAAIHMNSAEANEKYSKILGDFVKSLNPAMSRENIVIGGKSVSCSGVTFTVPESAVKELARALYDVYRENYRLVPSPASLTSFYDNLTGQPTSGAAKTPPELLPIERLDALMRRFETSYKGPLNVTCDISGNKLVRCVLSVPGTAADGSNTVITVDFGLKPKTDDLSLTVTSTAADSGTFPFALTLKEQNDPLFNASLITMRLGGETETAILKTVWAKQCGDLIIGLEGFGIHDTYRGSLKLSEGGAALSFRDLHIGDNHLALTLTARKGVKVPDPVYINLDQWGRNFENKMKNKPLF